MALPQAGVQLVAQGLGPFLGDMGKANHAVSTFGSRTGAAAGQVSGASQIMIGALRHVGTIVVDTMGRAVRAVGDFVGDSITAAGDFQQGLSVLAVTSGATADEMEALRTQAIALGNDITLPATSASDAADAMLELSRAGLSVTNTMEAAQGTLQLAAAAETDAATAAGIVANALNAFHLEGTQATRVADLLAAAANASSASMTDLSQGLQQGGFAFEASGQQIDDLVASLAILTNVGLTGSDSGTALKNAMVRLMSPTAKASNLMKELGISVFDANGQMLPLRDIIGVLNTQMAGMTEQERNAALSTIFLSDGMKAMIPLLDAGVAGFDEMKTKVNQSGAAAQLAGAQTSGYNGALAAAKNAVETLQVVLGTMLLPTLTEFFNNVITPGINTLGRLVNVIGDAGLFSTEFAEALSLIHPALQPIWLVVNQLASAFQDAGLFSVEFAESLSLVHPALQPLWLGLMNVIGAVQPLIDLIGDNLEPILLSIAGVLGVVVVGAIASAVAAFVSVAAPIAAAIAVGAALYAAWNSNFLGIRDVVTSVLQAVWGVISAVVAQIRAFWAQNGEQIQADTSRIWGQIKEVISVAAELIRVVVTAALGAVASFINNHGTEIQALLRNTWTAISAVISGTLDLIKGIITAALQIIRGDFSGAWETIKQSSASFVQGLLTAFGAGLDNIKVLFGGAVQWLIDKINSLPGAVAGVGAAIVDAIRGGFERAWQGFMSTVNSLLQGLRDQLPFSEPHDPRSPLYGLSKSGQAIVGMLQKGMDAAGPLLAPSLTLPGGGRFPQRGIPTRMVSPPASPNQINRVVNNTYYHQPSYHLGVTTNQSPAVVQQGFAMQRALSV